VMMNLLLHLFRGAVVVRRGGCGALLRVFVRLVRTRVAERGPSVHAGG